MKIQKFVSKSGKNFGHFKIVQKDQKFYGKDLKSHFFHLDHYGKDRFLHF